MSSVSENHRFAVGVIGRFEILTQPALFSDLHRMVHITFKIGHGRRTRTRFIQSQRKCKGYRLFIHCLLLSDGSTINYQFLHTKTGVFHMIARIESVR